MITVYESESYRAFLDSQLRSSPDSIRRHGVQELSEALRCHPTFITKVLAGKAEFSLEQAHTICEWLSLSDEDSEFFLDLVCRDRATNPRLRRRYEVRLSRARDAKTRMSQRIQQSLQTSPELLQLYYKSWLPQTLHVASQIAGLQELSVLALKLGVETDYLRQIAQELESAGIIKFKNDCVESLVDGVHLPGASPLVNHFHASWRSKVMNDLVTHRNSGG
ncbi:MAG: hypothetical protein NTV34_00210, partial [Proteobacteria bacterium]|nr:hypothetical protein [Pseudomonadota bacterium]